AAVVSVSFQLECRYPSLKRKRRQPSLTLQARIQHGKGGLLPAESIHVADELLETFADYFVALVLTFLHEVLELPELLFQGFNLFLVPLLAGVKLFAQRLADLVLDFSLFTSLGFGKLSYEFLAFMSEFHFFPLRSMTKSDRSVPVLSGLRRQRVQWLR